MHTWDPNELFISENHVDQPSYLKFERYFCRPMNTASKLNQCYSVVCAAMGAISQEWAAWSPNLCTAVNRLCDCTLSGSLPSLAGAEVLESESIGTKTISIFENMRWDDIKLNTLSRQMWQSWKAQTLRSKTDKPCNEAVRWNMFEHYIMLYFWMTFNKSSLILRLDLSQS